jgi:predicted ribosomally synthesized peptide with SipW-like signal peptide
MLQWKTLLTSKIALTLAAAAAVSVVAVGGTYANFTATPTTISSNAFTAGSLTMSRSGTGAVFSAGAMKIGDTAAGSITINNTGNLAGVYTLDGSMTGSSVIGSALQIAIYKDVDSSGTPIYTGSLAGLGSLALGTFAASSGSHVYYFHISLPTQGSNALDNALQGLTASETFTWNATQA